MIDYPSIFPVPLREGYRLDHVSPIQRTEMVSGRARQRRRFFSVPTMVPVAWFFPTSGMAQAWEGWVRDAINDGADWFFGPLKTPIGMKDYECRLVDFYQGPELIEDHWRISAVLEIKERPLILPGWGLFPEFVAFQNIIDLAVNREWPAE